MSIWLTSSLINYLEVSRKLAIGFAEALIKKQHRSPGFTDYRSIKRVQV